MSCKTCQDRCPTTCPDCIAINEVIEAIAQFVETRNYDNAKLAQHIRLRHWQEACQLDTTEPMVKL